MTAQAESVTDHPRRDCRCRYSRHVHGTRMAHELDGCRCLPCRLAVHHAKSAHSRGEGWSDGQFPDAIGVRRRIEALNAIGWSRAQLAERLGYTRRAIERYNHAAHLLQATHDRIAALYDELWNVTPVGPRVEATKNWASRRGFLPPLAWDDDTINDPAAVPFTNDLHTDIAQIDYNQFPANDSHYAGDLIDEIAVERAMHGDRVPLTKAELAEVVARLTRMGLSADEIGQRIGRSGRTVVRKRAAA